jgi:hypothetical protein
MSRKQGISLVKRFDREAPLEFIPQYLEYFGMSLNEFNETLARHVNKSLFEFRNGKWEPKFEPQ